MHVGNMSRPRQESEFGCCAGFRVYSVSASGLRFRVLGVSLRFGALGFGLRFIGFMVLGFGVWFKV